MANVSSMVSGLQTAKFMTSLLIDEFGLKTGVSVVLAHGPGLSEVDIMAACHHYRLTTI